ncbi:UNVERIFIED_CONTAM: hypothetical protein PYX00_002810 [Menopon gallinae]|uniref:WAPL domain-containing protein n=1 Tax=Menopon gallinae TaxID=328185 RepID=A0AAW2HXI1_9NEOP
MPVSMSRHYGRGYHRRGTPICQTSFPIDKLFKENSNRPSAARSAGTLGKWGITSFTTIRSSSYEPSLSKYSGSYKSQNQNINSGGDSYSFEGDVKPAQDAPPKPKKFFKSRNVEVVEEKVVSPPDVSPNKNVGDSASKILPKKNKEDLGTTSKKVYSSKSSPKSEQVSGDDYKPPIVLRIFKGTSCIVADSDKLSPTATSPVSPKVKSPKQEKPPVTRSTRRRSFQEAADTAPVSPRPKRSRKEVIKDPAIQNIISQLISDDEGEGVFESCDIAQSETTPAVDAAVAQAPADDASDDSLPLACSSFYSKKEENANKENEERDESSTKKEDNNDQVMEEVKEAKELLEETNVNFAKVVDNILTNAPKEEEKSVPDIKEVDPAPEPEPAPEEREFESGSDSSDAVNACGLTLTSKVESGGLKLVIKKTPEVEKVLEPDEKQEENVPAKVLPVKKKSIFKSRGKDEAGTGNSKRLALYKHNWNSSQQVEANNKQSAQTSASQYEDVNEFDLGGLTRVSSDQLDPNKPSEDITKVKCDKKDKAFYTVVRNVKKAHQIQESGEFQEFNDDVDYILDALQDNNPIGTRCLSAITLAGKCMAPAFRMHVRAHGTVAKFFKALHDATTDQSLEKFFIFNEICGARMKNAFSRALEAPVMKGQDTLQSSNILGRPPDDCARPP